jgi:hypothetical protein
MRFLNGRGLITLNVNGQKEGWKKKSKIKNLNVKLRKPSAIEINRFLTPDFDKLSRAKGDSE